METEGEIGQWIEVLKLFLLGHEDDIASGEEDFGVLQGVFVELIEREPERSRDENELQKGA